MNSLIAVATSVTVSNAIFKSILLEQSSTWFYREEKKNGRLKSKSEHPMRMLRNISLGKIPHKMFVGMNLELNESL